jgi:hypothetical protein
MLQDLLSRPFDFALGVTNDFFVDGIISLSCGNAPVSQFTHFW